MAARCASGHPIAGYASYDPSVGHGRAGRGRAAGAGLLVALVAMVVVACNPQAMRVNLLTAAPGQTVGNGIKPGQTPPSIVALPTGYTARGPWQINYTAAEHETIREVAVLVPTCDAGVACDMTVAIQTIDGVPIATATFAWKEGIYELSAAWDQQVDCTAGDAIVKGGATEHVDLALVLGQYQAYGSAVRNPALRGTRNVTITPVRDNGCQPSSATYGASGSATTFAASDFPFLPGGLPVAGLSPTWTAADLATAKIYSQSMLANYATVALMALYVIDPACSASPADCPTTLYRAAGTKAIATHLSMMRAYPASTCFADVYAADRKLAAGWQKVLKAPISRTAYVTWLKRLDTFARAFEGYFADCG
jgi:hypothetical protein